MSDNPTALMAPISEVHMPKLDNRTEVLEQLQKIEDRRIMDIKRNLSGHNIKGNIEPGSVILDVGCWEGETGIEIAADTASSLIQADFIDARKYKVGDIKTFPEVKSESTPAPDFTGTNADVAILVDILHHISYEKSWDDKERRKIPEARFRNMMKFIIGAATGVKPDGKILIINTRQEGDEDMKILREEMAKIGGLNEMVKII